MKNSENADTPISAIVYTPSPFRLSGKAAQASLRPLRSRSRISTPTLNQKTDAANIKKIANHSGHLELLSWSRATCLRDRQGRLAETPPAPRVPVFGGASIRIDLWPE